MILKGSSPQMKIASYQERFSYVISIEDIINMDDPLEGDQTTKYKTSQIIRMTERVYGNSQRDKLGNL